MKSSGSEETRDLTRQPPEERTLEELGEIQQWIDNHDWAPLGGPLDAVCCIATSSDVFSLGVILFELLSEKVPFNAASDSDVLHRIGHELPPRPRKLKPNLPRELEAIVLKSLEKDPLNRYASAGAMCDELNRFLRGEPVDAAPY